MPFYQVSGMEGVQTLKWNRTLELTPLLLLMKNVRLIKKVILRLVIYSR